MPIAHRSILVSLMPSLCLLWPAAARPADEPTYTNLYAFSIANYANGLYPQGNLAIDGNGVLYGTTQLGGAYNQCDGGSDEGCGTVYSLTPPASPGGSWTETVLWSFGGTPADAANPFGVAMGSGGVLYGAAGGGAGCGGTIFSLTPPGGTGGAWTEAVIYQFNCAPDGEEPNSGLVIDANGVLYGTTVEGGTGACSTFGCGTVFSLAPPAGPGRNWTETVLWSFGGNGDGTNPRAGLEIGTGGVLYGVTPDGGAGGDGVAFSLAPPENSGGAWTETVLYNFPASARQHPVILALGEGGLLYGTTYLLKGRDQGGTAFSLSPPPGGPWTETTITRFPARGPDAHTSDKPNGPLILDGKTGALFGATGIGSHGVGTVFELLPPKPGGNAWNKRLLDNSHTLSPTLGLRSRGVLYGTDFVNNTVWSLVP